MANPYTSLTAGPTMSAREQQSLIANPELVGLDRQRKMAELLLAQGLKGQPEGQMISGYYVAPSWAQRLSPVLDRLMGEQGLKDVDEKTLKLAEQLRKRDESELERFIELQQGRPAQQIEMAGPYGMGVGQGGANVPMPIMDMPAIEANRMAALRYAAQAQNPTLRQIGMKALTEGPIKVGAEETLINPNTLQPVYQGAPKISQDIKDIARQAKLDIRNIDNWTDQDWQKIRNIERQINESKRTVVQMPSEGERKAGFMATILDRNLLQMQTALGVDPKAVKPNVPASIVESIAGPNLLSRSLKPAQRQIIEDSQLDVLDAALTLRTGAAYTREQLTSLRDTYFPVLGDKPQAVQQKKQRLESLLEGAYIAAGRATPERVSAPYQPTQPQPRVGEQLNIPKVGGSTRPPAGIDPAVWNVMTPQEKALWQK